MAETLDYPLLGNLVSFSLPKPIQNIIGDSETFLVGYFPKIQRLWTVKGSDMLLWFDPIFSALPSNSQHYPMQISNLPRTTPDPEILIYDDLSSDIVSVLLTTPKSVLFDNQQISLLLVITTKTEISLIGVAFDSPSNSIMLLPTNLSVPISTFTVSSTFVVGPRIFISSDKGHLYEFLYDSHDGWFTSKCRLIDHTKSLLSTLFIPSFLKSTHFPTIISIVPSKSPQYLDNIYVLFDDSSINLCKVYTSANFNLITAPISSISSMIGFADGSLAFFERILPTRSLGEKLAPLESISKGDKIRFLQPLDGFSDPFNPRILLDNPSALQQGSLIQLMAITRLGYRRYYGYRNSKFSLLHIDPPPIVELISKINITSHLVHVDSFTLGGGRNIHDPTSTSVLRNPKRYSSSSRSKSLSPSFNSQPLDIKQQNGIHNHPEFSAVPNSWNFVNFTFSNGVLLLYHFPDNIVPAATEPGLSKVHENSIPLIVSITVDYSWQAVVPDEIENEILLNSGTINFPRSGLSQSQFTASTPASIDEVVLASPCPNPMTISTISTSSTVLSNLQNATADSIKFMCDIPNRPFYSLPDSPLLHHFNHLINSHLSDVPKYLTMTKTTGTVWGALRPLDILYSFLIRTHGKDVSSLGDFFSVYGPVESCFLCLVIITSPTLWRSRPIHSSSSLLGAPVSHSLVSLWASRAFFFFGGAITQPKPLKFTARYLAIYLFLKRITLPLWHSTLGELLDDDKSHALIQSLLSPLDSLLTWFSSEMSASFSSVVNVAKNIIFSSSFDSPQTNILEIVEKYSPHPSSGATYQDISSMLTELQNPSNEYISSGIMGANNPRLKGRRGSMSSHSSVHTTRTTRSTQSGISSSSKFSRRATGQGHRFMQTSNEQHTVLMIYIDCLRISQSLSFLQILFSRKDTVFPRSILSSEVISDFRNLNLSSFVQTKRGLDLMHLFTTELFRTAPTSLSDSNSIASQLSASLSSSCYIYFTSHHETLYHSKALIKRAQFICSEQSSGSDTLQFGSLEQVKPILSEAVDSFMKIPIHILTQTMVQDISSSLSSLHYYSGMTRLVLYTYETAEKTGNRDSFGWDSILNIVLSSWSQLFSRFREQYLQEQPNSAKSKIKPEKITAEEDNLLQISNYIIASLRNPNTYIIDEWVQSIHVSLFSSMSTSWLHAIFSWFQEHQLLDYFFSLNLNSSNIKEPISRQTNVQTKMSSFLSISFEQWLITNCQNQYWKYLVQNSRFEEAVQTLITIAEDSSTVLVDNMHLNENEKMNSIQIRIHLLTIALDQEILRLNQLGRGSRFQYSVPPLNKIHPSHTSQFNYFSKSTSPSSHMVKLLEAKIALANTQLDVFHALGARKSLYAFVYNSVGPLGIKDMAGTSLESIQCRTEFEKQQVLFYEAKSRAAEEIQSKLYSVNELFSKFCKPYYLWAQILALFALSNHDNRQRIQDAWHHLITESILTVTNPTEIPVEICILFQTMFSKFGYPSPVIFLDFLILELEDISINYPFSGDEIVLKNGKQNDDSMITTTSIDGETQEEEQGLRIPNTIPLIVNSVPVTTLHFCGISFTEILKAYTILLNRRTLPGVKGSLESHSAWNIPAFQPHLERTCIKLTKEL